MELAADKDDIARKARNAAREGGLIDTAQVRLRGLAEVQASAGPNWPRLKKRAREGTIALIEDHLEPDDLVVPCGDGFLVIFANAHATQIEARCIAIREGLVHFYLGEEGLSALRASVSPQAIAAESVGDLLSMDQGAGAENPVNECAIERSLRFVSVWSLKTNSVAASLCTPTLAGAQGEHVGYDPEFLIKGTRKEQSFLNRDLAILRHAILPAGSAVAHPDRLKAMQVHASTMMRAKSRDAYVRLLSEHGASCARLAFLTIAEIERGTPMISLIEWVALLRKFSPRIVLDFHYTDHVIGALSATGAWAASIHLPIQSTAQKALFEKPTIEQLNFWTRAAHERRMRLIVHGFREEFFVAKAARIGVDFGTGTFRPALNQEDGTGPRRDAWPSAPRTMPAEYAA